MKKLFLSFFLLLTFGIASNAQEAHTLKTLTTAKFTKTVWDYNKIKKFKYVGTQPILIDFNATWCGPCKTIHPYLVELQAEYGDKISIYSIDVDKEPDIANAFKVDNIPALVFIKDGKTPYYISIGKKSKEEIKGLIETHLMSK